MSFELEKLKRVANIAAQCCIDLDYNLKKANKEWLAGKISKGAFEYILMRHTNLYLALQEAGYTDNHKFFGFPVKPEPQPQQKD